MNPHASLRDVQKVLEKNRKGSPVGVYSICSAHPLVLEAAMLQARRDDTPLLIEATANQVNQFGGYTGVLPEKFPARVGRIAERVGLPIDRIVLGGDHLGPVCWTNEPATAAMAKARDLVRDYVAAGFLKIHLDASMACAGDTEPLRDEIVARRAAELCEVAERTALDGGRGVGPVYVIGTEVPPPGGGTRHVERLEVTTAERAIRTMDVHRNAFVERGLDAAWSRVIGLVVQPGVEFDHTSVHRYQPDRAKTLRDALGELPGVVYEAHSTDFQPPEAYRSLVRDHFAILKVGPQLTFALREAFFALSAIEAELVSASRRSNLQDVCDRTMLEDPVQWNRHYPAKGNRARWLRRFSYSDRIRYYWNHRPVAKAVQRMFDNLSETAIPLPLLSQFLPSQYRAALVANAVPGPRGIAIAQVMQVTSVYARACGGRPEIAAAA